jgi:hypothetical protein
VGRIVKSAAVSLRINQYNTRIDTHSAKWRLVPRLLGLGHLATMPVAALLPRYAPGTPFPEVWGVFRCSACGSKRVDARPNWAARRAPGQITRP